MHTKHRKKRGTKPVKRFKHGGAHWPPDGWPPIEGLDDAYIAESTGVDTRGLPELPFNIVPSQGSLSQGSDVDFEPVPWLQMLANPMKAARWVIDNPGFNVGENINEALGIEGGAVKEPFRRPTRTEWEMTGGQAMDFAGQIINPASYTQAVVDIDQALTEADKIILESFKSGKLSGTDIQEIGSELTDAGWNALFLLGAKPAANIWKSVLAEARYTPIPLMSTPARLSTTGRINQIEGVNPVKRLNPGMTTLKAASAMDDPANWVGGIPTGELVPTEKFLLQSEAGKKWMRRYLEDPAMAASLRASQTNPGATRPGRVEYDEFDDPFFVPETDPTKAGDLLVSQVSEGLDTPVFYRGMDGKWGKARMDKYFPENRSITLHPSDPTPHLTAMHEFDHETLGLFMEETGDLDLLTALTTQAKHGTGTGPGGAAESSKPVEIRARVQEMRMLEELAANKPITTETVWTYEQTARAVDRWLDLTGGGDRKMMSNDFLLVKSGMHREFLGSIQGDTYAEKVSTLTFLLNNLKALAPLGAGAAAAAQEEGEHAGGGYIKLKNPDSAATRFIQKRAI